MESRADARARATASRRCSARSTACRARPSLHICFGYPLFVPGHKRAYRFLAELADAPVDQISIETAQAELDLEVLSELDGKTIILGVIALDTDEVETPETVAERIAARAAATSRQTSSPRPTAA